VTEATSRESASAQLRREIGEIGVTGYENHDIGLHLDRLARAHRSPSSHPRLPFNGLSVGAPSLVTTMNPLDRSQWINLFFLSRSSCPEWDRRW